MTNANPESHEAPTFLRDMIAEDVRIKKERGKVVLPPIHRP
jgi:hypothetical protein